MSKTSKVGDFIVSADIPIPPRNVRTKWPFLDMKIGYSFVVKGKRARNAAVTWARNHGVGTATRLDKGDHYRIWRTVWKDD